MKIQSVLLNDLGENVLGRSFDKIVIRSDCIIVTNEGKMGAYLLKDFSKIVDCEWDTISIQRQGIIVSRNKKFGFYSYEGICILECIWDRIKIEREGFIVCKNKSEGFCDFKGNVIFECIYSRIENYHNAICACKNRREIIYKLDKH